jgi:hypothetical protein
MFTFFSNSGNVFPRWRKPLNQTAGVAAVFPGGLGQTVGHPASTATTLSFMLTRTLCKFICNELIEMIKNGTHFVLKVKVLGFYFKEK